MAQVLLRTLRKILNSGKRGGSTPRDSSHAGASPALAMEEGEESVEELSLHCLGSLEHADVSRAAPSPRTPLSPSLSLSQTRFSHACAPFCRGVRGT